MPVVPCPSPCPPITTGVVQFSSAEFVALYPEFTGIPLAAQTNAFNDATTLLDNTCGSAVQDANKRMAFLYMLTAHECFLESGSNDGAGNIVPPPGANIVGRVANASEGSVSAAVEWDGTGSPSQAYFLQTKYGAKFWQRTATYRMAFYVSPPSSGPNGPGFPFQYVPFPQE